MKLEKLYLNRKHNQWRNKTLYVEDEIDGYGLYISMPDAKIVRGSTSTIMADFKDSNGGTYSVGCDIVDYDKNIFKLFMPSEILSNDGIYEVVFSISYNSNGTSEKFVKTAIQTFSIIDTIEIDDDGIKLDTNYPILVKLIDEISKYKVDTSSFPTIEEVKKLIEESKGELSLEAIIKEIEKKDYVTNTLLNKILLNYLSKFDSAEFAKSSDLEAYVKTTKLLSTLTNYALSSDLKNYVLKEANKGLSTNDFTDALKRKLEGLNGTNGESYDDTELRNLIGELAKKEDVYTKKVIDEVFAKKDEIPTLTGLTVNDIKYDKNGYATLGDYLNYVDYTPISIYNFSSTPYASVYEKGVQTLNEVKFTWSLNKSVDSLRLTDCVIESPTKTSCTYNGEISDTKTFILSASDSRGSVSKSITFNFVYPFYYGTTVSDSIWGDSLKKGIKLVQIKENKTVTLNYEDSKVFFAYPMSYGKLKNIKDGNGFSYMTSFENFTTQIGGINYYVYLSLIKASAKNIIYTFEF